LERFQFWLDGGGTTTDDQKRGLFLDTLDDTKKSQEMAIAPRTLRETTYEQIILKLNEKIAPSINWLVHYSAFVRRKQKDGELGTEFMSDLNTLAAPCGFGAATSRVVLGQFVYELRDRVVQSKLMEQFDTITETSALAAVQGAEQSLVDTAKVRGDIISPTAPQGQDGQRNNGSNNGEISDVNGEEIHRLDRPINSSSAFQNKKKKPSLFPLWRKSPYPKLYQGLEELLLR